MDEIEKPYRTQATGKHFRIIDETERVILDCGDQMSAEQYAALLNEAFGRGFKAGFRAAKRGGV